MTPKRLRIRSFRSFKEEQEFVFPEGPGLFFLTGRNEVNPRLGANGAGKSTMWEALFWLFFDKIPSGLAAGDLAPWTGEKGTRVELDYEHDGVGHTLGRTWKPNRWYLVHENGADELLTKDVSNAALDHLGLSALTFQHSILMPQGEDMLLDLKPEVATSLFSQVMGLDAWLDRSAKAGKMAAQVDAELRRAEAATSRINGQLDGLKAQDLHQTSEEWEADRVKELDRLAAEHEKHLKERAEVKSKLIRADNVLADRKKKMAGLKDAERELVCPEDSALEERCEEAKRKVTRIQSALARLREDCNHIEDHPDCPLCKQPLPKKERDAKLMALLQEEEDKQDELSELEAESAKLSRRLDSIRNARSAFSRETGDLSRKIELAELDVRHFSQQIGQLDKVLDRIEDDVARLEAQKNPATAALEDLERRRRNLLQDLDEAQSLAHRLESRYRLLQYWVKWFKDIRLAQIEEALVQLEIEVNSCVIQLGLTGWRLLFEADSETKSGTIKRGFSVKVLSPQNEKPVPWRSWSGGEAQRLRIAGNMGFANLIRDHLGVTIPLEVWDEPTQYLSPQGVSDLLDSLAARAKSEQRQIWVVDHRSLGYGDFTDQALVVKTKAGSHFEV